MNYVFFEEIKDFSPKTKKFKVLSTVSNVLLGYVQWFGAWRKYTFQPEPSTVFDPNCLIQITNFMNDLMFLENRTSSSRKLYDLDDYQRIVTRIKKYKEHPILYLISKMSEESGEISKEIIRELDGKVVEIDLRKELGDLLWVITALAEEKKITLSSILQTNLDKLEERKLL